MGSHLDIARILGKNSVAVVEIVVKVV